MLEPEKLVEFLCSQPLHEFLQTEVMRTESGRISRAQKAFGPLASYALEQLHVHQKARIKVPWLHNNGWLFTQRSLEQCTSEAVARVKSTWLLASSFTDLTTGAGVDAYFASRSGIPLSMAENDPVLRSMLAYNFRCARNHLNICDDGIAYLQGTECLKSNPKLGNQTLPIKSESDDLLNPIDRHPIGSVAYIDPDRRPGGRRTFSWQDSLPNVVALMPRLCSAFNSVWVKSSPMTDPAASMHAWDGHTTDVFAICWQGELKEILFRVQQEATDECRLHAVHIYEGDHHEPIVEMDGHSTLPQAHETKDSLEIPISHKVSASLNTLISPDAFFPQKEPLSLEITGPPQFHLFTRNLSESSAMHINPSQARPGDLLFEPHAGLTRLNLSGHYAAEMGYAQLTPHVPYFLMNSATIPPCSNQVPGRIFRIRDVLNYQPKTLATQLKSMGINRAMMASKGFYLAVAQLRSTLKIPDGADAYLIFTTLSSNRPVCIVADLG